MKAMIIAFQQHNLGDDLMVWSLCRRYPHVQFEIMADESYKSVYAPLANLSVYSENDPEVASWNATSREEDFFLHRAKEADCVIHIGGSIYVQKKDWQVSCLMSSLLRDACKKTFVLGANFGPYQDEDFYQAFHHLIGNFDGICLRDRYSYELLKDLPAARYAPDILFTCADLLEKPARRRPFSQKKPCHPPYAAISLMRFSGRDDAVDLSVHEDSYDRLMKSLTEHYISRGVQVQFVSFCSSQGDLEKCIALKASLSPSCQANVKIYDYFQDPLEALRTITGADVVVGSRFHSHIFGWMAGRTVLPLVYDPKTLHVLQDLGIDRYLVLNDLSDTTLDRALSVACRLPDRVRIKLIRDAKGQFLDLDRFFSER